MSRAFEMACDTVCLNKTVEDLGVGRQCPRSGPTLSYLDEIGKSTLRNSLPG